MYSRLLPFMIRIDYFKIQISKKDKSNFHREIITLTSENHFLFILTILNNIAFTETPPHNRNSQECNV